MRYTKGPQIKQANRPTGMVWRRRRWRGRRRLWAREGSSYVFLLRGVNRCRIESGIVILLLYDTLFLSSSWLFMTVTKFSLPIRLYCIGVWSKAQFQMLPWEGYTKEILSRGGILSSLNYFCKITGRLLNQKLQYLYGLTGGKYLFTDHTFLIEGLRCIITTTPILVFPWVTPTTSSLE